MAPMGLVEPDHDARLRLRSGVAHVHAAVVPGSFEAVRICWNRGRFKGGSPDLEAEQHLGEGLERRAQLGGTRPYGRRPEDVQRHEQAITDEPAVGAEDDVARLLAAEVEPVVLRPSTTCRSPTPTSTTPMPSGARAR